MSRIGKKTIDIPVDVLVTIDDRKIGTKGKYGSLEKSFENYIQIERNENKLNIIKLNDTKESRAYHGLTRALIQNMIIGVNTKFSKILVAEGVGYKFQLDKQRLILNMGYTHPIEFIIPSDLEIKAESPTKIILVTYLQYVFITNCKYYVLWTFMFAI